MGICLKLHAAIADCVWHLLVKAVASNCITAVPLLRTYVSVGLEFHQITFKFNVLSKSNTLHEENVFQQRYQSSHDEGHKQVKMQNIARTTQLPVTENSDYVQGGSPSRLQFKCDGTR